MVGVLLVLGGGCGARSWAPASTTPDVPVASPTAVPGVEGRVTTTSSLLVTDDGSGPRMCRSGNWQDVEPHRCDEFNVEGFDWSGPWDVDEKDGSRWGYFTLTGTFDGSTFTVEEVSQPDPEPYVYDFEIPCPTPEGGWRVVDPATTTRDAMLGIGRLEDEVPGFAMVAVSTSAGEPAPRDPMDTVVSLYVAGDPLAAEQLVRRSWGGMLCVVEVEHSLAELEKVQRALLDVPGMTEVGSGNADNVVELSVLSDDGSIQRWVDQEFGEGLVVVRSNLQPVG